MGLNGVRTEVGRGAPRSVRGKPEANFSVTCFNRSAVLGQWELLSLSPSAGATGGELPALKLRRPAPHAFYLSHIEARGEE